ncbi:sensor histidine kinase [Rugosimonospora acidiphila]|uniref:sensor histidine kinase n=1 Tax=Rugosimonospora acidiphila TaxID=556531 RepID=UPI0031ED0527
MSSVLVTGGRILRAPVTRRTWAELAYVIAGAPLALLGAVYVVVSFLLSAGLAVTALGIPLLAVAIPGARGLGRVRRGLARVLLEETIVAPAPFRPGRDVFARIRAGLRDLAGWRAVAYLVVSLPGSLLGLAMVLAFWAWGVIAFTYPIQHALGINQMTAPGRAGGIRHGLVVGGVVFDTWPRLLVVCAAGAVLVLSAPWVVRTAVLLDRLLVRGLLGPDGTSARITELRRTRAHAVDEAAATLRRIERDLHDGVQARLVALGMNLTMAIETLDGRTSGATRGMLVTARDNAKEAISELRDVVRGIHPPVLDAGLDAAIATLAARSAIPVDLRTEITERPSAAIETIAYFCAAELLTNVAKHSGADRATVEVTARGGRIRLRVADNGRGGAGPTGGTGLRGLADRVATVDGTLDTDSPPAGPTVITVDLPLHA